MALPGRRPSVSEKLHQRRANVLYPGKGRVGLLAEQAWVDQQQRYSYVFLVELDTVGTVVVLTEGFPVVAEHHHERRVEQAPLLQRAHQGAERLVGVLEGVEVAVQ